jgi:hypothetical protein
MAMATESWSLARIVVHPHPGPEVRTPLLSSFALAHGTTWRMTPLKTTATRTTTTTTPSMPALAQWLACSSDNSGRATMTRTRTMPAMACEGRMAATGVCNNNDEGGGQGPGLLVITDDTGHVNGHELDVRDVVRQARPVVSCHPPGLVDTRGLLRLMFTRTRSPNTARPYL